MKLTVRVFKILLFVGLIAVFSLTFENMSAVNEEESEKLLSRSVERAVTDCYALEGVYPPDFSYLEKNYGVHVDNDKYFVDYEVFGSNIRPVVQIIKRGKLEVGGDSFEN